MGFVDSLKSWADHAFKQCAGCMDEASVKNALVEPFISDVLGFYVHDLNEVKAEHLCSFGPGKTEKVD